MWRQTSLLLLACVVVFAVGCEDSETLPQSPEVTDPLVSLLVEMGFRPEHIEDHGEYFLVEGDIAFSKMALRDRIKEGTRPLDLHQWRRPDLVSQQKVATIKVKFVGVESGWKTASLNAMATWNNISGSVVSFSETSGVANTTVTMANLPSGQIAVGEYPANGNPGTFIKIDPEYNTYSVLQKQTVMAHEFGHTIGLRHTNWQSQGEETAILIGNTPQTDASSVMNSHIGGIPWNGFSFWDIEAIRVLYPNVPVVTVQYINSHPALSWSSIPGATGYRVYYQETSCYWDSQAEDFICDESRTFRTSTSSTSYTDPQITYTGTNNCDPNYIVFPAFQGGTGANSSVETYVQTGPTYAGACP